jgi:hypothetical protein
MIQEAFDLLKLHNLVDWGVISLGVNGVPGLDGVLSLDEIAGFAYERLAVVSPRSPQLANVVALATDSSLTSSEMRDLVSRICGALDLSYEHAARRWRLAAVELLAQDPEADFVRGLMNIEELALAWSSLAVLHPLPATSQLSEGQYSSEENYRGVLSSLGNWERQELAHLVSLPSANSDVAVA